MNKLDNRGDEVVACYSYNLQAKIAILFVDKGFLRIFEIALNSLK